MINQKTSKLSLFSTQKSNQSLFISSAIKKYLYAVFMFLSSQLLTGCWEVTTTATRPYSSSTKQTDSNLSVDSAKLINSETVSTTPPPITDIDTIKTFKNISNEAGSDHKIRYDIPKWQKLKISPLDIYKIGSKPAELAKVITTDTNSLDFASQNAIKYRFMKSNTPYFDLVDSERFVEVHWYFAHETDTKKEKETSISHAKKAHRFSRQLLGDGGGNVVADMLTGQTIRNKKVGDINIALAKCEFYSCMLILEKNTEKPVIAVNNLNDQTTNTENQTTSIDNQMKDTDNQTIVANN